MLPRSWLSYQLLSNPKFVPEYFQIAHKPEVMRFAASDVEEGVVPNSGHWIMEENAKATIELVRAFLDRVKSPEGLRGAAG